MRSGRSNPNRPSLASVGASSGESWRLAPATWHPIGIPSAPGHQRALGALLGAVHRGLSGGLAPARGFDDAPVDNDVVELEADDLVVGLEAQVLQAGEDASGDPLIAATAHGGGRAGGIGDLVVGGAQHEYLDELVEHEPVGDPGPVAAQGMVIGPLGQQRGELDPQRFKDGGWDSGHEGTSCTKKRDSTPHLLQALMPATAQRHTPPTGATSYVHRIYCLTRLVTWGGRRRFRDLMDAVKVWAWWGSRS